MKQIMSLLFAFLFSLVFVNGFYYSGDKINIFVDCYNNEGFDDIGCSNTDSYCLDADDDYSTKIALTLAELSDANAPGLWNGTYTPTNSGTHSCIVRLTNSNSTIQSDSKSFSIRPDVLATQTNVTDTNTTISPSEIQSGLATTTQLDTHIAGISKGLDDNRTRLTSDTNTTISPDDIWSATSRNITTLNEINSMIVSQSTIDNETRTWLGTLVQNAESNINNTLTLNVIGSYLADVAFGLSPLKTLIDSIIVYVDILPATTPLIWNENINITMIDFNQTLSPSEISSGVSSSELNISLSTQAQVDNQTRQQIISDISSTSTTNITNIARCAWGYTVTGETCSQDKFIQGIES